jgi:hypothetical protein
MKDHMVNYDIQACRPLQPIIALLWKNPAWATSLFLDLGTHLTIRGLMDFVKMVRSISSVFAWLTQVFSCLQAQNVECADIHINGGEAIFTALHN